MDAFSAIMIILWVCLFIIVVGIPLLFFSFFLSLFYGYG